MIVKVSDSLHFSNIQKLKSTLVRIEKLGSALIHPGEDRINTELRALIILAKNITDLDARF